MKSKYKSSKSVAKNQTVPISVDDPRAAWDKIGQTKARQGAEIELVGLDGKSLIAGGTGVNNPTGTSGVDKNQTVKEILIPPVNNQPPSVYPGGSGATVIIPTDPTSVTAAWSGDDLVVQFQWDYANELNKTVSQFILEITSDGVTRRTPSNTFLPNKTQSTQTLVFTKALNTSLFNSFRPTLSAICVLTADPFNNISQTVCAASIPAYTLNLQTPVIGVSPINNGYTVAYTVPTSSSFNAIDIWEIESPDLTAPAIIYAADGITPTNYQRSYFSPLSPANIITANYNQRFVIARYASDGGIYTTFCVAEKVTPTSTVGIDNQPPKNL